jgi:hypothetical protein
MHQHDRQHQGRAVVRKATPHAFTGNVKAKSVSCPSDVTAKAGGTFTCHVTLVNGADGSQKNATVTIHMTDSSGHVELGGSDFHL